MQKNKVMNHKTIIMKKLLLSLVFFAVVLPAISQMYVSINGYVTNSANGYAVPNHAVTIVSDSSFGWVYSHTVYTNPNGFYVDTIPVPAQTSGALYVWTVDCQNYVHQQTVQFSPAVTHFTVNFSICHNNVPCTADFSYYQYAPRSFQFTDQSQPSGNTVIHYWNFGDGTTSTLINPQHVYGSNGWYVVTLTISDQQLGCTASVTKQVYATDSTGGGCQAAFYVVPDSLNMPPYTYNFYNYSTGNIGTYIWNFGDGNVMTVTFPGNPDVIHTYAQPGVYNVCLTVQGNDSLCYDITCDSLLVGNQPGCQAAFTYAQQVPLTVIFFDGSIGGSDLRLWSFGDGTTSTEQNPVHVYPEQGYYTVTLTIGTPGTNCYSTIWQTPYVWGDSTGGACQAAFFAVPDSMNMPPFTYQFISQSTGNIGAYIWNFGDGNVMTITYPGNPDVIHTYAQAGVYNVCLTVQGNDSLCYDITCDSLLVGNQPGCQANFYILQQQPLTVQFFDSSIGGGNLRQWSFGDGGTSSELNPVHVYPQPGYYNVTLTIGAPGTICNSTVSQTISVWDSTGGGCQAAFHAIEEIIDSVSTFYFHDESTGNIAYWYWHFGDPNSGPNNTSTLQNPDHIFSGPGVYNVCLTVRGTDSTCYSTVCMSIIVGSDPGCQANFTYYEDPIFPFDTNYTVNFTDLSTGSPTAWYWDFGDGTSGSVQNPVHTYAGPGTYNVCLTITGNNCTSTWCQNLTIQNDSINYHQLYGQVFAGNFPLSSGLAIIFSLDTTANYQPYVSICPIDSNGVYYFTLVPDGNYYIMAIPLNPAGYLPTYYGNTVMWQQATLIQLGTENNPYNINLVPAGSMTYGPGSVSGQIGMTGLKSSMLDKVNMILMNEQGSPIGFTQVSTSGDFDFASLAYGTYLLHPEMPGITSDLITVTLSAEQPHADVVMTFTGNRILGSKDDPLPVSNWKVFPNPVTDRVSISLDLNQGTMASVEIISLTGIRMAFSSMSLQAGGNLITLEASSLPEGIYLLRIHSAGGLNVSTKFLKIR